MGQVKLIGGLLLTGLFAIAIITFAVNFSSDNDASFTLDSDITDQTTTITSNIEVYGGQVNTSSEQFSNSETGGGDSFSSGAVFKGGNSDLIKSVVPVLWLNFRQLFGSGGGFGIFFNALAGFLVFLMIMYTYKAWVGRNPD